MSTHTAHVATLAGMLLGAAAAVRATSQPVLPVATEGRCWSAAQSATNHALERAWLHCAVGIELNPAAIVRVVGDQIRTGDADERAYAFLSIASSQGSADAKRLLAER